MEAGAHARTAPLKAIRLLEFTIVQFQLLESDF